MSHVIAHIFKNFRLWERPSQIAFLMALILAVPALVLSVAGDDNVRGYAVASLMASLFVAQLIFLWASRGMVSDYTRAQRHFLRGEFDYAQRILSNHILKHPKDVQAMTLLGNTYRQLGDLDHSHAVLLEAINIQPMNHFPLYGFGRTLLVAGQYEQALRIFQKSLKAGGHDITYLDIGECAYHLGDTSTAREALTKGLTLAPADENRVWMAQALLNKLDNTPLPHLNEVSRAYWTAQAHLFAHTPYGEALNKILAHET